MRALAAILVLCVLAGGCAARQRSTAESAPTGVTSAPIAGTAGEQLAGDSAPSTVTVHAGPDEQPPADNKKVAHTDDAGMTPADVVLALRRAMDSRDWKAAYSLYGGAQMTQVEAARQWAGDQVSVSDFKVREERTQRPDLAWVRVTYVARSASSVTSGTTVFDEPGVWWAIEKTGGLWKVRWMPTQ